MIGAILSNASKGVLALLGGGVALGTANVIHDPKNGFVANTFSDVYTTIMNSTKEAGVDSGFQGFYKFFEKLAKFIESFTGEGSMMGMTNWARRGMGVAELNADGINPGGNAASDEPGSIQYTPENELSLTNFFGQEALNDVLTGENLAHKANVFAHGAAQGTTYLINIGGHVADIGDSIIGGLGDFTGWYETNHSERNISESFGNAMLKGVDDAWDATVGVPELKTAWDRAVHFTGEVAPAAVVGFAAAPAVSNAFLGAATNPSAPAIVTTGIGLTGLTTAVGVTATGAGLAVPSALENG